MFVATTYMETVEKPPLHAQHGIERRASSC